MRWISDHALDRLREAIDLPDLSGTEYRIIDKVGSGGMATVYLAEDGRLQRAVALKVMSIPDPTGDLASRMLREARIVAQLEHPSIVPVHDVGTLPDGRVFYVMKLVQGARLDSYAVDGRSLADLLRVFQKICEAVAFAHAHGVIHRDLKPENVMVGPFGEVLVMDWGVAKVIGGSHPREPEPPNQPRQPHREVPVARMSPLQTAPGTVLGTPAYMAPEQAEGKTGSVDQRTDVYALGALLYFLLTRRPPGDGTRDNFDSAPPRPRLLNRNVPRAVEAICAKAMSASPCDRYASAEDLASDVARYLDGSRVTAYHENVLESAIRWIAKNRFVTLLVLAYLLMRVIIFFVTGR